jgi:gamma-glutamylcyclotransferase (GGCT)/AIG2-like uncharacterized protein YtfP
VIRARIFVYGTLKRGFAGAHLLLRDARFEGAASTAEGYALYDLGAYPALVRASNGVVRGEAYSIPRDMLAVLDAYEGVPELYERQLVTLDDGEGAQAYVMHPSGAVGHPRIEAGVWLGPRIAADEDDPDANF